MASTGVLDTGWHGADVAQGIACLFLFFFLSFFLSFCLSFFFFLSFEMRTCHIVQTRGSSSASAFPVLGCWAFTTTPMKGTCSAGARSCVGLSPTTTKKRKRAGMVEEKGCNETYLSVPENMIAGLQSASCSLLPTFLAKSQGKCDSGWVTKSSNGID